MLFETARAEGIAPERLVEGMPVDVEYLTHPRHRVAWSTFIALNERLGELLDRDPERLRRFGERMLSVPSFEFLQRIARLAVSPAQMYELGNRWIIPALHPGLPPIVTRRLADGRIFVRSDLPVDLPGSEALLHVFTGNLRATPTLVGLPSAIVDARVWSHGIEATIRMPSSHTLVQRARRSLRGLRGTRELYELLEAQHRDIEEGFAALIAAQGDFRRLFDRLPTLVMIHRAGRILWVNRTFVQKLGFEHLDEVVGRTVLELTDPASHATVARRMGAPADALADGHTRVGLLRRDGRTLTVEVSPAQSVDFGGGPARLAVGVDVSERVALEQRLVVADRVASINLLGAGVAHEINNPLAYALASVELAAKEVARLPGAPPVLADSLSTALEGLGRVRAIVRDLRVLARSDEGSGQPTDVREVLDSTLTLAASALAGRARVVREYRDVPLAAAGGARLGQVALNLVLNAVEAMPARDGDPGELRVRTLVDEVGRVAFEVEDTGAGIAPEVLPRIFDPFFTTKAVGRGTGLGLAICHQIVAGFGGEIGVRSAPGRGSTFRVALPRAVEDAAAPRNHRPLPNDGAARRRVLVVDDEPHLVTMIERMLGAAEYDVTSASSAAAALGHLSRGAAFDVVLCDLMMAEMNGMQMYEELRRTCPDMAARVVFMTGGAFTREAREFLARVPNRCLEKPFTMSQLDAEMRRTIAPDVRRGDDLDASRRAPTI